MDYKAYPSNDEEHIILKYPDGQEEYHELYHGEGNAHFEAPLMYPRDDVRFTLLMKALDQLNTTLYGDKQHGRDDKILGDWSFVSNEKGEVVITHSDGSGVVVNKEGGNDRIAADMLAKLALDILRLRKEG